MKIQEYSEQINKLSGNLQEEAVVEPTGPVAEA